MKHIYIFLCLFAISGVVSADNVIVGAFGQKLGATIDENIHKYAHGETLLDARGVPIYKFFPEKNIGPFMDYLVKATPSTNRIFKIWAVGRFIRPDQCLPQRHVLQIVLENKYPHLKSWTSKDSYTWEVHSNSRFISVQCIYKDEAGGIGHQLNAAKATILIRYVDTALDELVLEERASMIDASNF